MLAISNLHVELMNLKRDYAEHNFSHRELSAIDITKHEAVNKVGDFILPRGNTYTDSIDVKIIHFITQPIVPMSTSSKILNLLEHRKVECEKFPRVIFS